MTDKSSTETDDFPKGWPHEFLSRDGLHFRQPVTIEGARWWNQRFPSAAGFFPRHFIATLCNGVAGYAVAEFEEFDPVNESFTVEIKGLTANPGEDGETAEVFLKRQRFELKIGVASDGLTKVAPDFQGDGIGTLLMINLIRIAKSHGMQRVDIEADDIGRYTWPTMGFLPTERAWLSCIAPAAKRTLRTLHLTDNHRHSLNAILDDPDPIAARILSVYPLNVPGPLPGGTVGPVPVGKLLLLAAGTAWEAHFDLHDEETEAVFEAYEEKHNADHPRHR